MTHQEITYLHDSKVDSKLDREIRTLLTTCFTKDEDGVFRHRRYYKEPYPNRWVIRDEQQALIAHVGAHEKEIRTPTQTLRFGGIAEVCVHPDWRGRGYVKAMLAVIHDWLAERGFAYAILFGDPEVYTSSGYSVVDLLMNAAPHSPENPRQLVTAMVHPLGNAAWPAESPYLSGPNF